MNTLFSEIPTALEATLQDLELYAQKHSWNLMTQMKEYLEHPIIIERGEGSWLYDIHNNKYLDGNASMWTNVHGHNHPELNAALIDQLSKFADTTYVARSHSSGLRLAHKLATLAPQGLTRAFFTNNGSTAIESALKMSFQYWQLVGKAEKSQVISLDQGHHGLSFGATAISNNPSMHGRFKPWTFPCKHFPSPHCTAYGGTVLSADDTESIRHLELLLNENAHLTACVVLESQIQSVADNGMKLQPPGFLKKVEKLCKQHQVHLILDEVFTGCGRTGSLFACEKDSVSPDFLCLGKGISAGYLPLGATLTKEEVYEAFLGEFIEGKALIHGHTNGGNALATAVAFKSIELLEERILSGGLSQGVKQFEQITTQYFENHPYVKGLRQRGFVCAIDLHPGDPTKSFPPEKRVAYKVCQYALKKGLLIRAYKDSIFLIPPLSITPKEMQFLCERLSEAISEYISTNLT